MNCSFLQLQPRRLLNVCVALPPLSTSPYIKGPTNWSLVDVMQPMPISQSVPADNVGGGGGRGVCNLQGMAACEPACSAHVAVCTSVLACAGCECSCCSLVRGYFAVWLCGAVWCGTSGHAPVPASKSFFFCCCPQFSPLFFRNVCRCYCVLRKKKTPKKPVLMVLLQCS